jgi:hypothetical protein
MQEIVDAQAKKLQSWKSDEQFVIFDHATEAVLDEIDHEREHGRVAKCTRMTHYTGALFVCSSGILQTISISLKVGKGRIRLQH